MAGAFDRPQSIDEVSGLLQDGKHRLLDSDVPMRPAWFPQYLAPDNSELLMSDYGLSASEDELIAGQFHEEVDAIREWLCGQFEPVGSCALERVREGVNRKAQALAIWDWCAVPLRQNKGFIYRIWSPRDVLGSPTIRRLPIQEFLARAAQQSASDALERGRLIRCLRAWRIVFAVSAVIVGLGLLEMLVK